MWKFWKSGKSGSSRYLDFLIAQEFVNPMSGNRVYGRVWLLSVRSDRMQLDFNAVSSNMYTSHTLYNLCVHDDYMMDVRTCADGICGVLRVYPMGLRRNLFFFFTQHQSLLPVEAQTCGWTGSVSLSPTVPRRAPQVEEWTCQCVGVRVWVWETCKGFERIVFCVFFVCFSVGKLSSGALVVYDNQYNSRFWPGVECWSCFSLRHRNGLRYQFSTPSVLVFSVGRLQVCLVAFSIACAVAGARYGGSEEGTPTILYVIFLIILLVLHIWECFQFCERLFSFSCMHWNILGSWTRCFQTLEARTSRFVLLFVGFLFVAAVLERGEGAGERGRGSQWPSPKGIGVPLWLARLLSGCRTKHSGPPLPGLFGSMRRACFHSYSLQGSRLNTVDFPVKETFPSPACLLLRSVRWESQRFYLDIIFLVFSHFENLLQIFVHNFFTFVKCLTR